MIYISNKSEKWSSKWNGNIFPEFLTSMFQAYGIINSRLVISTSIIMKIAFLKLLSLILTLRALILKIKFLEIEDFPDKLTYPRQFLKDWDWKYRRTIPVIIWTLTTHPHLYCFVSNVYHFYLSFFWRTSPNLPVSVAASDTK